MPPSSDESNAEVAAADAAPANSDAQLDGSTSPIAVEVAPDARYLAAAAYKYPRRQLNVIGLALLTNAMAVTTLFPFIGLLIEDLDMTDDRAAVGWYAGYVASAFMGGRMISSFFWGAWSDKHGRKPIMVMGVMSIIVFQTAFGFSFNYPWAIGSRLLFGLLNPIVGTAKTVVSEICSHADQAKGMVIITATWGCGLIFGPSLGGILARPADKYPSVFAKDGLFGQFPYLLPCVVISASAVVSLLLVYKHMEESLGMENGVWVKPRDGGVELVPVTGGGAGVEGGGAGAGRVLTGLRKLGRRGAGQQYAKLEGDAVDSAAHAGADGAVNAEDDDVFALTDSDGDDGGAATGSDDAGGDIVDARDAEAGGDEFGGEQAHGGAASGDNASRRPSDSARTSSTEADSSVSAAPASDAAAKAPTAHDGDIDGDSDSGESKGGDGHDMHGAGAAAVTDRTELMESKEELAAGATDAVAAKPKDGSLLRDRVVLTVTTLYSVWSMVQILFDEVMPLWAIAPLESGGLGLDTSEIGAIWGVMGVLMLLFQVIVFPLVAKRYGALKTMRGAVVLSVPALACVSFARTAALYSTPQVVFISIVLLSFVKNGLALLAFTANFMLINNSVPSHRRGECWGCAAATTHRCSAAVRVCATATRFVITRC